MDCWARCRRFADRHKHVNLIIGWNRGHGTHRFGCFDLSSTTKEPLTELGMVAVVVMRFCQCRCYKLDVVAGDDNGVGAAVGGGGAGG